MKPLQVIWNIDPEIFRIGSFGLRYYSLMFVMAFLVGYAFMSKIFKKEKVDETSLQKLLIYVLLGTIIGARLGQTLFYEFGYYKDHILEIIFPFKIRDGNFDFTGFQGLASHGGAIGILLAIYIFCKRKKQSYLWILDRLVIVVAIAGFFIRVGNLFNSEILGKPTDLPWAFVFLRVDAIPRHPSQLYEAICYLLIFFTLWITYQKYGTKIQKGFLFGLFLILVFSARFLLEYTKENQEPFESSLPLNMGQILSIPFIVIGAYFIFRKKQNKLNGNKILNHFEKESDHTNYKTINQTKN